MKKSFLSLLCALALCLGLLPVTALAAEGAPTALYVGNQQVISASSDSPVFAAAPRVPTAMALRPASKTKTARAKGSDRIQFGRDFIDLIAIAQLVDAQQASGVAEALEYLAEIFDGRTSLTHALAEIEDMLDAQGLDGITGHRDHPGHITRPRGQEIAAALNRYRGLRLVD